MVQETPSLFTDQSQTHQNAVNEHFPPSGLHLPAPVVLAQRARDAREGGGQQNGESLSIGVERQPGLGLGCLSVENKRNRFIVGGAFFQGFLVRIFLKMHQQAAALGIQICIFVICMNSSELGGNLRLRLHVCVHACPAARPVICQAK